MDWRKKVELYEQIRREYEFGVGTIQGVARKLGVHRRMVRDDVVNALPARRKEPQRLRTKLGPATGFIDAIVVNDRKEPRKQRHTAHRIWQRMREELGVDVAERTVRQYVQQRKRELGVETAEVFIAQSYGWGHEAPKLILDLPCAERAFPSVAAYDQLLGREPVQ